MKAREILLRERRANKKEFGQILSDATMVMGFECEMLLPVVQSEGDSEAIDPDEITYSELSQYLADDNMEVYDAYSDWIADKIDQEWTEQREDYTEQYCIDEGVLKARTQRKLSPKAEQKRQDVLEEHYSDANDKFREEKREEFEEDNSMDEFIEDKFGSNTRMMSRLGIDPRFGWNHDETRIMPDEDSYSEDPTSSTYNDASNSMESELNVWVRVSDEYHGDDKRDNYWYIEPDSSIETNDNDDVVGAEIVSPPLDLKDAVTKMDEFFEWMGTMGATTNESTGLHINLSREGYDENSYDYLKMILLFDENHTAQLFGRLDNSYAAQMRQKLIDVIAKQLDADPSTLDAHTIFGSNNKAAVLDTLKKLGRAFAGRFDKYFAINNRHNGVFEFRGMGGAGYEHQFETIRKEVVQMANMLRIGSDPDLYAEEYLTKAFAVLNLGKFANPKPGSGQRDQAIPMELQAFSRLINRDGDLADKLKHLGPIGLIIAVAKRVAVGRIKLDRNQVMTTKRVLLRAKMTPEGFRNRCNDDNAYNVVGAMMRWPMALGSNEDERQATLPYATPGYATPQPTYADHDGMQDDAHFPLPMRGDVIDSWDNGLSHRVRRDWRDHRDFGRAPEMPGGLGAWTQRGGPYES